MSELAAHPSRRASSEALLRMRREDANDALA
jgi:hypothetical protein